MNRTDYRFTLTRDIDTFEATAHNFFAGSFVYEQEEGQLFFRQKFNGDLIFKGADYSYIKTRYDLGTYCDIFDLLIEKIVNGSYEVYWMGYFSITDCKFDFEKCEVTVEPTVSDQYDCILNNYDLSYNVLEQDKVSVTSYINSKIEFIVYPYFTSTWRNVGDVLVDGAGDIRGSGVTEFECIYKSSSPITIEGNSYYLYVFAREVVLLKEGKTPTGSNWLKTNDSEINYTNISIEVDGSYFVVMAIINYLEFDDRIKWGRRISSIIDLPTSGDILLSLVDTTDTNFNKYIETYGSTSIEADISDLNVYLSVSKSYYNKVLFSQKLTYTNAVTLIDTLNFLLNKTCSGITVSSAFLTDNINPVTQVTSKTNNLRLLQKSDIKKPQASEPASKGEFSLEDILNLLYVVFQLYWYIEDNVLYLIHESEIDNLVGINITSSQYISTTAHKKVIEFDKSLLYRFEKWELTDADNDDFLGTQIEYSEYCTAKNTDAKTKTYDSDKFTTDLAYMQVGGDDVSDTGFCLVACDSSNEVILEIGNISNSNQLNGHLSIANFQYHYWRHNRILKTGLMNGVETTFITTQEIRELDEQQIILCEEFDPLKKVVTDLGNAIVTEAEFFPYDSKLVLNLSI